MKNIFEVSPESHYKFELKKLGNIKKRKRTFRRRNACTCLLIVRILYE